MKTKKILALSLAVSMMLATLPGMAASAATAEYDGVKYQSVPIDLVEEGIANNNRLTTNNLFDDDPKVAGNYGIWGEDLLSLLTGDGEFNEGKSVAWKEKWADVAAVNIDYRIDTKTNILTFNNVDYIITVPFVKGENVTSNQTAASDGPKIIYANGTQPSDGEKHYNTIDVPDGYYNGISMLGGGYYNMNGIIFRYVYEEGEPSVWKHLWCKDMAKTNSTTEPRNDTGLDGELRFHRYESGNQKGEKSVYLYQMHNAEADGSRKVVAIDFIAQNASIWYGGKYDYSNMPYYKNSQNYQFQMIGLTMLRDTDLFINQLKEVWDKKPANYTGSTNDRAWMADLKTKYALVEASGLTSENLEVYNEITAYIADVGVMDANHTEIEAIYAKLSELPKTDGLTTANVTAENTEKLAAINALDEARKNKYPNASIDAEHKAMLDALAAYNTKYQQLKVEISETEIGKISDIIKAEGFPTLEDLQNKDAFTEEVQSSIKTVEGLMENVVYDEVSETSKAIYDKAGEYVAKLKEYYAECNEETLSEVADMLSDLPAADSVTYTPEENNAIYKLYKTWDEKKASLYVDYLTEEQNALCQKAEAYKALITKLPEVSAPISPDVYSNMTGAFSTLSGGVADDSNNVKHAINGPAWMAENVWEDVWSVNASDGYGENTIVHNGITYKVKVASGNNDILSGYTALSGIDIGYDEVDVADGLYTGVSFIGGGNKNASHVNVAFKYKDDDTVKFCTSQKIDAVYNEGSNAIAVPSLAGSVDSTMYLHQYTFENPHPEKGCGKDFDTI